jgi:arginine-tRNA-protein transferase
MRHTLPVTPQFYVTAPQPCPYLDGRMERKLFTALQGDTAERLNDALSKQGFRRSQNVLYRPSCADCAACLSARIRVADFAPSRSQRRTLRDNGGLRREATTPWATEEQFALFRRYLDSRHADGGMADMDIFEFAAMIEETPVRSRVVEYTLPDGPGGRRRLVAVSLTDVLDDGLSMVYSFYDPDLAAQSLGTYVILDHVALAREAGLPFVYLGYWVPGSRKMGYKAKFGALEIYHKGVWRDLGDPGQYSAARHPLSVDPIAEQVARLSLPDSRPTDARPREA